MLTLDNPLVPTGSFDTPDPSVAPIFYNPTPPLLPNPLRSPLLVLVPPPAAEAEAVVLSLFVVPIPLLRPSAISSGALGRLSPS